MSQSILRTLTLLVLFAVMTSGCGNDAPSTSPSDTPASRGNETFGATLNPGQSQFYSFSTGAVGTTDVTLISIRPAGNASVTLSPVVGLGLGTPQGTDCALSSATNTTPGLKTQVSVATNI